MSTKNNKFVMLPIKINFEVIDVELYQAKVESRCNITKIKNASLDQVVDEMNQMTQKYGLPYSIEKVRRN